MNTVKRPLARGRNGTERQGRCGFAASALRVLRDGRDAQDGRHGKAAVRFLKLAFLVKGVR